MPRKTKSTLANHSFPAFYACYLLKSVRTLRSTATYIGSTPSPPRRIRQHNGEITQGAWKTKHNRPWVMQMIVHGFPSKLAALQFEWAWQHPHISRHLRDNDGQAVFSESNRRKNLKSNVSVARSMICSHPYSTWPLRVALFTEEASKAWKDASTSLISKNAVLPVGFTCTLELEGVDGQSGKQGAGRKVPIDVTDSSFTTDHLSKWTTLLAAKQPLQCSVCRQAICTYPLDPLATALCPTPGCHAVSHLLCLSESFLRLTSSNKQVIPRGGECSSCGSYVLWGDVIRGCYRHKRGTVPQLEDEGDEGDEVEDARATSSDESEAPPFKRSAIVNSKGKAAVGKGKTSRRAVVASPHSSGEVEFFNLEAVSGSDDDSASSVRSTAKPHTKGRAARGNVSSSQLVPDRRQFLVQQDTRSESDADHRGPLRISENARNRELQRVAADNLAPDVVPARQITHRFHAHGTSESLHAQKPLLLARGSIPCSPTCAPGLPAPGTTTLASPVSDAYLPADHVGQPARRRMVGINVGGLPGTAVSQDRLKKRPRPPSLMRRHVRDSHSTVVPSSGNGVEAAIFGAMEDRPVSATADPDTSHTPTAEIPDGLPKKRSLAPFPPMPALSQPHHTLYIARGAPIELSGDDSANEIDTTNPRASPTEPRSRRHRNAAQASHDLHPISFDSSESDNSEASQLSRALSRLSVSSDSVPAPQSTPRMRPPSETTREGHHNIIVLSD